MVIILHHVVGEREKDIAYCIVCSFKDQQKVEGQEQKNVSKVILMQKFV